MEFRFIVCWMSGKHNQVLVNTFCPMLCHKNKILSVLIDFSLTVKVATLLFIPGSGSAISSAKQGKSGSIYKLVINL